MTTTLRPLPNLDVSLLCTLGPASLNERVIRRLDEIGVGLFRINLSHARLDELEPAVALIRRVSTVPICLDSEGAQVRTADYRTPLTLSVGDVLDVRSEPDPDTSNAITLTPQGIISALRDGDLLLLDFNGALIRIHAGLEAPQGESIGDDGKLNFGHASEATRYGPIMAQS